MHKKNHHQRQVERRKNNNIVPRVFSFSTAILENKKTLGTRLGKTRRRSKKTIPGGATRGTSALRKLDFNRGRGTNFLSLVEKNDSACRLYHCCVSYLSSTYLWLVERSIISTTLRELRGGSRKFGKGQGTEKTENSLKIIQNLTDWMGWPISPLGRPLNPPILKSRTLAPVLRV